MSSHRCLLWRCLRVLVIPGLAACACTRTRHASPPPVTEPGLLDGKIQIVREFPHDPKAFTQGLQVLDGKVYESTGLEGESTIRRVDLESGVVEQKVPLPAELFGEGLTFVRHQLLQLTWQNQKALVWDVSTLRKLKEIPYEGEGWGVCYDGRRLVMSDGSDTLAFRDPDTFEIKGSIQVRRKGKPLARLNELECVRGLVFANIWQTRNIATIDPGNGEVVVWFDAAPLFDRLRALSPSETAGMDVLNGIAYLPWNGHFLLTGKRWPRMFEVNLVTGEGKPIP